MSNGTSYEPEAIAGMQLEQPLDLELSLGRAGYCNSQVSDALPFWCFPIERRLDEHEARASQDSIDQKEIVEPIRVNGRNPPPLHSSLLPALVVTAARHNTDTTRTACASEHWSQEQEKAVEVERPLFPGYIFAKMVEGVNDFSVPKRVIGVRDYLRFEGIPCAIQEGAILAIRRREGLEYERAQRAISGVHNFTKGEPVRVAEGPFSGFAAEVYSLDPKGAITALVNLFGRKTKAVFDGAQLEKV